VFLLWLNLTVVHVLLGCRYHNSVTQKHFSVTTLKELFDTVDTRRPLLEISVFLQFVCRPLYSFLCRGSYILSLKICFVSYLS